MLRQRISSIKFFINQIIDKLSVTEAAKIISLPTMILVTGGTGLVGSQIVFDLISAGENVRVLKRKAASLWNIERLFPGNKLPSNLTFIDGDLTDGFSIDEAMEGVDTIYHSAAYISFFKSDFEKMMRINVGGTANMVNLALKHNIRRFCHISSVAAIGREKGEGVIDENSEWKHTRQDSNYALSKFRAEREVWRAMEEGLSAVILNPSIIIGPGDWKSGSTQMFGQIWKGMPYYSDGATGFVDVRDVSKCALLLTKSNVNGERFIVNCDNVPYRYVFDLIAENLGKKKAYIHVTPFLAEIGWRLEAVRRIFTGKNPMITKETARNGMMQWNVSNQKIKNQLGIEFIPIKKSIEDTAKYFLREHKKKH
jgi:dihydroflavonol-4-reductase